MVSKGMRAALVPLLLSITAAATAAGSENASLLRPKTSFSAVTVVDGSATSPLPVLAGGHLNLVSPTAVAARGNDLFVVDSGLAAVLRIDPMQETATILPKLPNRPGVKLHVMSDRSLLALDPGSRRVLHYSRDGAYLNDYRDDVNLIRPVAVTVDEKRGLVLVADSMQNLIVAFHLSGTAFSVIAPTAGDSERSLSISGLAVGADGLYVLDKVAREVLHLTADGKIIESFGADVLQRPVAITADSRGRIVVADAHSTSLKIFVAGDMVEEVKDSGLAQGPWRDIADVYADDLGSLYVAERGGARVDVMRFAAPAKR